MCDQSYHTPDSARLDFVEIRPVKISPCKHPHIPSCAAPLAKRNLRNLFPMHLNTNEAFTTGAWSPCHLPPPSETSRLTAVERLWVLQRTLEALGFAPVAGVGLTERSAAGKHQQVWASAPNAASTKAKRSKFSAQLLPTQSGSTKSFSRLTTLWIC